MPTINDAFLNALLAEASGLPGLQRFKGLDEGMAKL